MFLLSGYAAQAVGKLKIVMYLIHLQKKGCTTSIKRGTQKKKNPQIRMHIIKCTKLPRQNRTNKCQALMASCTHVFSRDSAPGQKECDSAIGSLNRTIRELDQASLEAIRQSLTPRDTNTLKGFQEQMINSAREILDRVEDIRQAARQEPENLGHLVSECCPLCLPVCLSPSLPLSLPLFV